MITAAAIRIMVMITAAGNPNYGYDNHGHRDYYEQSGKNPETGYGYDNCEQNYCESQTPDRSNRDYYERPVRESQSQQSTRTWSREEVEAGLHPSIHHVLPTKRLLIQTILSGLQNRKSTSMPNRNMPSEIIRKQMIHMIMTGDLTVPKMFPDSHLIHQKKRTGSI